MTLSRFDLDADLSDDLAGFSAPLFIVGRRPKEGHLETDSPGLICHPGPRGRTPSDSDSGALGGGRWGGLQVTQPICFSFSVATASWLG